MITGSFLPKSLNYRQDGTGRDSYIKFNNGGFSTPSKTYMYNPRQFGSQSQSFIGNPGNRTVRYQGNGTGRDTYIAINAGGFEVNSCKAFTFEKALRNYGRNTSKFVRWQRSKERSTTREIKKRQEVNDMRLSTPKIYKGM